MLRYTIDRARPGLVALYDIRPYKNGAGQFLQPRSPHGASFPILYMRAFKKSQKFQGRWIRAPLAVGVADWVVVCLLAAYCGTNSPLARAVGRY